jgi:hypothetical protein
MTNLFDDGSASAPAGTPLLPTLLSGYVTTPPWEVAGVNYAVGVPSGTALQDPSTLSMAGVSVDASSHTITVTGSNVTLNGYDFGPGGGWGVYINSGATNTVIENSHFLIGSNNNLPIDAASGSGNLTVQDNTLDGGNTQNGAAWALVSYSGSGTFNAQYNAFLNAPEDGIDFNSGTMTTNVNYNVFENLGTSPGAHPDPVQYVGVNSNNSTEAFNTIFQPSTGGMQGVQVQAQNGSTLTNTTIENNTIVAKGASIDMSYSVAVIQNSGDTINGATVENNYIDDSGAYGPFYPPSGSNLTFGGNVDLSTGATIPNPSGTTSGTPASAPIAATSDTAPVTPATVSSGQSSTSGSSGMTFVASPTTSGTSSAPAASTSGTSGSSAAATTASTSDTASTVAASTTPSTSDFTTPASSGTAYTHHGSRGSGGHGAWWAAHEAQVAVTGATHG